MEEGREGEFQCSSASRKFLNGPARVLRTAKSVSFSALQRAENSSMPNGSSSGSFSRSFSALQRAENSSMSSLHPPRMRSRAFQCSSASRKFLNTICHTPHWRNVKSFSALQRAENSSMKLDSRRTEALRFQCSSASRKFLNHSVCAGRQPVQCVSVLFSEPKIPQSAGVCCPRRTATRFSALQRAENSSIIPTLSPPNASSSSFSALQRAENSSIPRNPLGRTTSWTVSVLFSEPKIPQSRPSHLRPSIFPTATITLRRS